MLRRELDCLVPVQKEQVWLEMEKYIPKYFRTFLDTPKQQGEQVVQPGVKQGNHHSALTILALTLELDGAFDSEESLYVLQTTIEIIQKQIYKMGGSLSKVYYDGGQTTGYDGGLQIIAEWGLHGLNYHDNASRACIAALKIQKAIHEFILLTNVYDQSSANDS